LEGPAGDPRDESIGDLVNQLVDDARAYAKAEVEVVRQIARHRAGKAKTGAILLVAGAVLLVSSLTALLFGLVLGLAVLIGPLLSGLVIAALLAGLGYLLVRSGLSGLGALAGDEEERAALKRGETRP
jgi:hypothetical protein